MRRLLLTILLVITGIIVSFSQTSPDIVKKEAGTNPQKFYFPASFFKDPVALAKAVPGLAQQVLDGSSEKEKADYKKVVNYYLLIQDYPKAIASVDSLQKKEDDNSSNAELKSYAVAKIKEKSGASFDGAFKQDFSATFSKLSFTGKIWMAFLDSSVINRWNSQHQELAEKLGKNGTDSLDREDARKFLQGFLRSTVYAKILPLIESVSSDPRYRPSYPVFKNKDAGVYPVEKVDEAADPNMQYKLLMELTAFAAKEDSTAEKDANGGLVEIARKINLHVAAGIPKKNLDVVVIVHASALYALLNNEKYKKKYELDNPNIALIKELQSFGAKILVCGQAMDFHKLEKEDLLPGIKQAMSAQTVLSMYQLKGYTLYNIKLDR